MDFDLCTSDSGDGCGGSFTFKTSPGLCAKCQKLATLKPDSEEYATWTKTRQCNSCGLAWKNLTSETCGRCAGLLAKTITGSGPNPQAAELIQSAVTTSRLARAQAFDARLNKQPVPSPMAIHTTAGLSTARVNNTPTGENKVFIAVECRVKSSVKREQNSTDADCGRWGKPWSKEDFLSEVLDDSLVTLNSHWSKRHGMELLRDEVEFRWAGNKRFLPGTANDQVGNVYNAYMTGDMGLYYGSTESRSKKSTAPKSQYSMALELYIDKPQFLRRRNNSGSSANISLVGSVSVRKRSATTTSLTGEDIPQHKRHAGSALISCWVPTSRSTAATTSVPVKFVKACTTCDSKTGQVEIVWLENAESVDGFLGQEVLASGSTKNVYQLSIGSDLFVAKRFFEIGSDGEITAAENEEYLRSELVRLKTVCWMLKRFKEHAKENSVEIARDIVVSDGFLVRELGQPSVASGLPPFEVGPPTWLIEPRRTRSVVKFSGTLVHPSRADKIGITLVAFVHFSYEISQKQLVFADIQGSPMNINGRDTLVLFDVMSHSQTSDSGIGDHGPEGIKSFLEQHVCNYVCNGLKLASLAEGSVTQSTVGEDEEDELDED